MILLIGYGNSLRNDDGAGQRVAETIADWNLANLRSLAVHQLTPELAELLTMAEKAIFVDVYPVSSAQESGLQVMQLSPDAPDHAVEMGHALDPRSLLALTQQVYGAVPLSWWILIPAIDFEFGEQFSAITQQGILDALEQVKKLVQ